VFDVKVRTVIAGHPG